MWDSLFIAQIGGVMVAKKTCLPKEFHLGGYTYDVREVDDTELKKTIGRPMDEEVPYGAFNPDYQAILIRKNMTNQMKSLTLMHEITHAIMYNNNVGMLKEEEQNEDLVDRMGMGFMEVIKRNPEIISFVSKAK